MMAKHRRAALIGIASKQIVWLMAAVFCLATATAQTNGYFVSFVDKKGSAHSLEHPQTFLSERALLRRHRQNIGLDSTDLPVSAVYVDSLKRLGIKVVHGAKWLNGAIVFSDNTGLMDTLSRVSFVRGVELNKGPFTAVSKVGQQERVVGKSPQASAADDYGESFLQLQTVNGIALHQQGFLGDGIHIAVVDAGFYQYPNLPLTAHLDANGQILGYFDFVDPGTGVVEDDAHGMHVLSILAGSAPGQYVGSAPNAQYWLFRAEDVASEYPIEADYWMCAAEKADSAGVDVINSSLGYGYYTNSDMNLPYSALDGSSRISRAANMAVDKGMVVVNSAGNEGNKWWTYQLTPADASLVVSVGAIAADSTRAVFSSIGPTADNRYKPDVMAMGVGVAVQWTDGTIVRGNGTSYAAPIVSGLVACLWQKMPSLTSHQLVDFVKKSSHRFTSPDNYYGYGIPDFDSDAPSSVKELVLDNAVWPNPFSHRIEFTLLNNGHAWLFDALGRCVADKPSFAGNNSLSGLSGFPPGIYYLKIVDGTNTHRHKLIKR